MLQKIRFSLPGSSKGHPLPPPADCRAVVITGSHAMVTDNRPWSVKVANWIPMLVNYEVPFLGICYGHQLLAQAMAAQAAGVVVEQVK